MHRYGGNLHLIPTCDPRDEGVMVGVLGVPPKKENQNGVKCIDMEKIYIKFQLVTPSG